MEQENKSQSRQRTPELIRPLEGRLLAGVAKGISNRLGVPDWVVRVAFCVTLFVYGLGLVVYAACWALTRSEDEAEPPAARFFDRAGTPQSWIGIGLIFFALLFLLDAFTFLSKGVIWAGALLVVGVLLYNGQIPFLATKRPEDGDEVVRKEGVQPVTTSPDHAPVSPGGAVLVEERPTTQQVTVTPKPRPERSILGQITMGVMLLGLGVMGILDLYPNTTLGVDFTPRHYLALATTVIGLGLLVGSIWGRARWLILVAVVLTPTLFASPLMGSGWWFEGERTVVRPTTFEALESDYTKEAGTIRVDLTQLPWDGPNRVVAIGVDVTVGSIEVIVPNDVQVEGTATIRGVGSVQLPNHQGWGVDRDFEIFAPHWDAYVDPDTPEEGSLPAGIVRVHAAIDVGTIFVQQAYTSETYRGDGTP